MAIVYACLVLGPGAVGAFAAASWLPPADISGMNELIDGRPKVAVDPTGNAVAIWERHVGGKQIVEVSERPAGRGWSTPERISGANEEGRESQVAIDDAGNAYAVWVEEGTSVTSVIRSAVRPAGGEWSDPEDLSDVSADAGPPDEEAGSPDVGMSAAGEAVAVWWQFDGSNRIVQAAAHPAGAEWSDPEDLSETGQNAHEPQVAIDPDGDAVATWSRWDATASALMVQAAVRAAGDDWSDPEDLSEAHLSAGPAPVAIDSEGNAVAIWLHPDDSNEINKSILQAAVRPPGGEWSEPEDLSAAGEAAGLPDLAFDAAGNGIAVFGRVGDDGPFAQAAGYDFAGPRLDALQIPATGTAGEPIAFSVSPFDMFLAGTSWTFGDGQGAGGNAVSHTYSAAGTYQVTVGAVDDADNTTTQTGTIAIAGGPVNPPPPRPRIAVSLRIESKSLRKLLRTGTLRVSASVNDAASVALSGRARLRAQGKARTRLVPIFVPKTLRFVAAGEQTARLTLSEQGRKALRPVTRARIRIEGEASALADGTATGSVARTLRD